MRKSQATELAQGEATEHGINIVVTYNPYAEEFDSRDRFSYHPEAAKHIFKYEEVVATLHPQEK